VVGDLGHPFYREERQRDGWNEASAVGLQLVLWLGLGTAAGMVWLGGAAALPYAVALFLVLGAASWVSVLYAHKPGVCVEDAGRVLRLRLVPYGVLFVAFLTGTVRAVPADGFGAASPGGRWWAARLPCCGWCGAGCGRGAGSSAARPDGQVCADDRADAQGPDQLRPEVDRS
jgi:hypothetical protein